MSETNQDLPPQLRPPQPPKTIPNLVRKQYHDLITLAQKNPQLMLQIARLKHFQSKFGYRLKLIFTVTVLVIIISLGFKFGSDLADTFRPPPASPPALPTITPTPTIKLDSDLEQIRQEVQNFPILLPDPAIPPVDPEIYLETPPPRD